jgi:hypothetical protein
MAETLVVNRSTRDPRQQSHKCIKLTLSQYIEDSGLHVLNAYSAAEGLPIRGCIQYYGGWRQCVFEKSKFCGSSRTHDFKLQA